MGYICISGCSVGSVLLDCIDLLVKAHSGIINETLVAKKKRNYKNSYYSFIYLYLYI